MRKRASERESVDIRDLWLFILLLSPSAGDADIDLSVVLIAAAPCSPFRRPLLPLSLLPPFGVGGGVQRGVTGVAISLTSLSSHYKHGPQPGSPAPHAHPLSPSRSTGSSPLPPPRLKVGNNANQSTLRVAPPSLPLISLSVKERCRRLSFPRLQLASIELT